MNSRIFEELARQHQADMRRRVAGRNCPPRARALAASAPPARGVLAGSARASARHDRHTRDASRSLRARAGWWLVDLGLKLAVRPDSHRAASPRPAGS